MGGNDNLNIYNRIQLCINQETFKILILIHLPSPNLHTSDHNITNLSNINVWVHIYTPNTLFGIPPKGFVSTPSLRTSRYMRLPHGRIFSNLNYPYKIWIRDTSCGSILTTVSATDTPSGSVVMWLMLITPSKGFLSQLSRNMPNSLIYDIPTVEKSVQNTLKIHVFWYILIHTRKIIVIPMI